MVNQDDIIGYFKKEFKSLMQGFNDTRQLNYLLDEKSDNGLVDCNWSQQYINISFKIIPINYYLSNPAHVKIFEGKPEAYKNYFNQVARHEYGHSISCESFNKLHSYRLSFNEFFECSINNQLFRIYLNEIFFEFLANYLVYEKMDKSTQEEHIEINFHSFQTTFTARYKIFELIKVCLLQSQVFYIYAQWDKLNPVFMEYKVSVLLDYLYIINDIFKKIFNKNMEKDYMDMDSVISDITDLAIKLDGINWIQMILENYSDKNSFVLLENFKKNFQ